MKTILVTGGHGFIGSNLIVEISRTLDYVHIVNLDLNTYAASPQFLHDELRKVKLSEKFIKNIKYTHFHCDIRDTKRVERMFQEYKPDYVIHLAAESHVCNSIDGPRIFMETNIMGTFNLLEAFRKLNNGGRFLHVSTDEVFGELPLNAPELKFSEVTPVAPRSPYAASKASSDHIVQSYFHTYGMDTIITNCSNNYGKNQHEEKLIPKTIRNILNGKDVIIHGEGNHIRDWIFVEDHCKGIMKALFRGLSGERYCFGGEKELTNLEVVFAIQEVMEKINGEKVEMGIQHTHDRPTDDERYAVCIDKVVRDLDWYPSIDLFAKFKYTVEWYMEKFKNES